MSNFEEINGNEECESMEQAMAPHSVRRITDGLEFGDGAISAADGDPTDLRLIDETIYNHPAALVAVDADENGELLDDDGCGDGRPVTPGMIFRGTTPLKRSLNRPKVFGGALAMTAAMRIGLGKAAGAPLTQVYDAAIDHLQARGINFGAHTADHVASGREELDSGCGAIDNSLKIIQAAVSHETAIRGAIKALGFNEAGLDEVYDNFREYAATLPEQSGFSGKAVIGQIIKHDKVVKQLQGAHCERRIVINTVRDFTVNQGLIRNLTDDRGQVFAVDAWRLGDIAHQSYPEQLELQQKALLSELVYTIATAAVLTKGDLPIDVIEATEVASVV